MWWEQTDRGCIHSYDDTSHNLGICFLHLLHCVTVPNSDIILLQSQNIKFYYNMLYSIKKLEIMQVLLNRVFIKWNDELSM